MSSSSAESLRQVAREWQAMADICRGQIQGYERTIAAVEGRPEFARFMALSKRLKTLTVETGHCLDAISAETEAIADSEGSNWG